MLSVLCGIVTAENNHPAVGTSLMSDSKEENISSEANNTSKTNSPVKDNPNISNEKELCTEYSQTNVDCSIEVFKNTICPIQASIC